MGEENEEGGCIDDTEDAIPRASAKAGQPGIHSSILTDEEERLAREENCWQSEFSRHRTRMNLYVGKPGRVPMHEG
jgi:hypothetical protein